MRGVGLHLVRQFGETLLVCVDEFRRGLHHGHVHQIEPGDDDRDRRHAGADALGVADKPILG